MRLISLGQHSCRSICTRCWSKLQILLLPIPQTKAEELSQQLREFFLQRIRSQLQEERLIDYDLVNAVLGKMIQNMGYGR